MSIGQTQTKWMATLVVAGMGVALVAPAAQAAETPTEPAVGSVADIVINEVESSGDATDWIELKNTGTAVVDASGLQLVDNGGDEQYSIPADTTINAGDYLVVDDTQFTFGMGSGDSAILLDTDGTTVLDEYTWTSHAAVTYGRCPDGTGEFADTAVSTRGAANDCQPPVVTSDIVINEVESNGDDTDWIEVMNIGTDPVDISGWVIKDDKDTRPDTVPSGSIVAPGGLLVIDQKTSTYPEGFDFGLGNPDEARLYLPDGTTLVASYAWADHAAVTWARCPDGTGEWIDAPTSTKGRPNDCNTPLRINEVESSDGDNPDWIELINVGDSALDITGLVLSDNKDSDVFTIPATPALAAGAIVVFERTDDPATGFDYGLGSGDNVRLFESDGVTLIDLYEWTEHAATTFGRCPDDSGDFEATAASTKGATNSCVGIVNAQAWPGGSEVSTVDAMDTYAGDMSGIDYDASTGSLWAVQNGDGLLYHLIKDGDGNWVPDPSNGWANGKKLRYPGGTGTVDAEGVTVTGAGASAGVYVSSERNNDSSSTSRPSILKFAVDGAGTELTASAEWNLAADFPGLGANAGIEGVTYVSDTFLTAGGFVDQNTAAAYQPTDYAGHGNGLFFVGVEGTAGVYAYALVADGTFERVAELDLSGISFGNVADVQFDADRALLWVVCDDACGGRIATFELTGGAFTASALYERPAGMANIANEGFAIADASTCVDGKVATFYADDANTDGFSLRTGTLDCEGAAPVDPTEPDPTEPDDPGAPRDCPMTAPSSAHAGRAIAITVDPECSGPSVSVYMYSAPTFIGTFTVGTDGVVSFKIPSDLPAGTHKIELQLADGTIVGSTTIELAEPGDAVTVADELSQTGAPVDGTVLLTAVLLLSGAAVLIARRRAAHR